MGKLFIVVVLISIAFTSCGEMFKPQSLRTGDSTTTGHDFTGDWFWESADTTKSFKVILFRQADSVYGQYCAAYDKGNRLDCEFNSHFNMFGHKVGDSVVLRFTSFYGAKNGEAVLKLRDKVLEWRISRMPVGGDCFAPADVVMYRSIKNW